MAEIRVNSTGGVKFYDADDSHYAQIKAGTITSDTDVLTLGHDAVVAGTKVDLNGQELILDADADTSITADTDDQIDIRVAGTDQLTIKDGALSPVTDNDVDIGTSSLEFKDGYFDGTLHCDVLDLAGTEYTSIPSLAGIDDQSSSNDDQLTITDTAVVINEDSDDVDFRVEGNGVASLLHVNAGDDRVGIGGDPDLGTAGGLHIKIADRGASVNSAADELVIEGSSTVGMSFLTNNDQDSNITFGDSDNNERGRIQYSHDADFLAFYTAGSERMRMVSDGSIHIGATSGIFDASEFFTVNNVGTGSGDAAIGVKTTHINGQGLGIWNTRANGSGDGFLIKFAANGGSGVGNIKTNGSNTSYNTSSDYRLKEAINYNFDATTRLKQLKPARFNWIEDETNTTVDGFIAHEVSSVVPEAVQGQKDATETANNVVLDVNNKVIDKNISEEDWTKGKTDGVYANNTTWKSTETVIDAQSIDQAKLVPLLVKTVQELEARITTLEG